MKNEREIFIAAREVLDPVERRQLLENACGDDDMLKKRVEDLLAEDVEDSFMQIDDDETVTRGEISEKPGTKIGPYKLIEKIGEGGFGVVFMAEQIQPVRRKVALKVIKPGMDTQQVIARFEAERQALAIMDHPNIAKVLDAGTTQSGRPFFVMELVKGIPITKYCDERRIGLNQRLELFVSVCHAIQHAHSKGVIHRDIKPGNVLVALYDDRPVVKVIDFGIAKATGGQLTEKTLHTGFGAVVGSLEYMSPEQASFNQLDVDTRSDVYSLGVLLYELLTGVPPLSLDDLRRAGMLESLRMIRESETVRPSIRLGTDEGLPSMAANRNADPSRLMAIVKGELDWIVMKALEKDRGRRYETVKGLSEEIDRFLRGEPVLAHPPSRVYRLRKWMRKNWKFAATTAAILILGIAIVGLVLNNRNRQSNLIAEHSRRVQSAMSEASLALGAAGSAPIGQESEWISARAAAKRLNDLLELENVDPETFDTAKSFLADFEHLNADRQLAEQIENVVMMSATQADVKSWQKMERQFEELFLQEGIDASKMSPSEFAQKIRDHRSAAQLCDALELWIGAKGQIAVLGGPAATKETMQPLADAMLAADRNPVRSGIRKLIYERKPFELADVQAVVAGVELETLPPRTLSWLGSLYGMIGEMEKAAEVYYLAVEEYPDDFMLNFDFALSLQFGKKWSESIRYYLRCTALRPDVSGVWRALGNAYRENRELARSVEALRHAVRLSPSHSPIRVDLAQTLIASEEFNDAELESRRAIELNDEFPASRFYLARALMEQGKIAEALVALNECEQLNKMHPRKAIKVEALIQECKHRIADSNNQPSDQE